MKNTPAAAPAIAHHERRRSPLTGWTDRFLGADPGLTRLIHALQRVANLGAGIAVTWLFVRQTGALLVPAHVGALPPAQLALVNAENRGQLIGALALGGLAANFVGSAMSARKVPGQLLGALYVPVDILAGLALGLALGVHRVPGLVMFVILLGGGAYLRRFGPRWMLASIRVFVGFLVGFLLHGAVPWSGFGWMAAEAALGTAAGVLVQLIIFNPLHHRELGRYQRSYLARVRKTVRLALAAFDEPGSRAAGRLPHHLVRLNEAALIIDASLAVPGTLPAGVPVARVHEQIFDIELALSNIGRLAPAGGRLVLPEPVRGTARRALLGVAHGDLPAARLSAATLAGLIGSGVSPAAATADEPGVTEVVLHRLAGTVTDLADALDSWSAFNRDAFLPGDREAAGEDAFASPVVVAQGQVVGSAPVSAQASAEAGRGRLGRVRLTIAERTAIQVTVAAAVTVAAGDALSAGRFYWALLAVFIGFVGTSTSGEQARKVIFRVAGTVVGAGISIGLVHAVGHDTAWALTIILAAWFVGFYLMPVNYALFIVFLVIALGQLYNQVGEFTNTLLFTRLAETALGAAIVVLTLLFVVPLHPRRVIRVALRLHVSALAALVERASAELSGSSRDASAPSDLRGDIRKLDTAHHSLVATADPLRPGVFGDFDGPLGNVLGLASAYRNYARHLVADLPASVPLPGPAGDDLRVATRTLRDSIGQVADTLNGQPGRTYTRSAGLFDRVELDLLARVGSIGPDQFALRDLRLIDEAVAELAGALSMPVVSYDTAGIERPGI